MNLLTEPWWGVSHILLCSLMNVWCGKVYVQTPNTSQAISTGNSGSTVQHFEGAESMIPRRLAFQTFDLAWADTPLF